MSYPPDWPVGEYPPHIPTMPRVYRCLDAELAELRTKLADTKAELDNLFPALISTNTANAVLSRELQEAMTEVHELRDQIAECHIRLDELSEGNVL